MSCSSNIVTTRRLRMSVIVLAVLTVMFEGMYSTYTDQPEKSCVGRFSDDKHDEVNNVERMKEKLR